MMKMTFKEKIIALFENAGPEGLTSVKIQKILESPQKRTDRTIARLVKKNWLIPKNDTQKPNQKYKIPYIKNPLFEKMGSVLNQGIGVSENFDLQNIQGNHITPINNSEITTSENKGEYKMSLNQSIGVSENEKSEELSDSIINKPLRGFQKKAPSGGRGITDEKIDPCEIPKSVAEDFLDLAFEGKSEEKSVAPVPEEKNRRRTPAEMRKLLPADIQKKIGKNPRTPETRLLDPYPPKRGIKKSQQAKEKINEEKAAANVHVRYRNIHPNERDFLFYEQGWTIKEKNLPGSLQGHPNIPGFIANNDRAKRIRKACHRGRQRADTLGAKYDNYHWAVHLTIQDADSEYKYKAYRQSRSWGCEKFEEFYEEYFSERLKSERLITRTDIETGAPELLPENFDPTGKDPKLYDKQIEFYHEVLEECDRLFRATPHYREFYQRVAEAVKLKILPTAFVEGYGEHHMEKRLKDFFM
jgi:hypothetical protein